MITSKKTHIRWMIRRDLQEVINIEASTRFPWTEEDVLRHLRQRATIGMVAEKGEKVVGYMIFEMKKGEIELHSLVVHPEHRHSGVGTAMIDKIKSELVYPNRRQITLRTADWNTEAQLFFRQQGFRAIGVEREYFMEGADAYVMTFTLSGESKEVVNVEDV